MNRSVVTVFAIALSLSSVVGCGFLKSLAGRNSVDLSTADVKSVKVDLRKPEKTICPREMVQMAVFADVQLKGEKQAKTFETYAGGDEANRNDKLEFADFAFQSDLGAFDQHGRFKPVSDLRSSLGREFVIKTAYKRQPDRFTLSSSYKPDYRCIKAGGGHGSDGASGRQGAGGQSGSMGSGGDSNRVGGAGGQGSSGGQGGNGADGLPGPSLKAFVTMVKTPFYDRLIAVRIAGDTDDFLLAPADQAFTIAAIGGSGGAGGDGGKGGNGGGGGSGFVGGTGGAGGMGGPGGMGGRGGPGGTVRVMLDPAFPELAQWIKTDVSGGAAGHSGQGGASGSGGSAGSPIGQGAQAGARGPDGSTGTDGTAGESGPDGRAEIVRGGVSQRFADITGLTLLAPQSAIAEADDSAGDKPGRKMVKPTAKRSAASKSQP